MIQANLIPMSRRLARQRQHRIRRWSSICTAYSVLLVIAYGTLHAMWGHGDQVIEHDVTRLSAEIAQTDREIKAVAPRLQEAQLTLAASMAVGSQPNWSILLALLAKEMRENDEATASFRRALIETDDVALALGTSPLLLVNDEGAANADDSRQVVLSHCELTPISEVAASAPGTTTPGSGAPGTPSPTGPSIAQPRYTLALTGMGRTQAAVSQYVLRLERTGLFDRVTLIETRVAPFGSGQAVSFRIGCTLGEMSK